MTKKPISLSHSLVDTRKPLVKQVPVHIPRKVTLSVRVDAELMHNFKLLSLQRGKTLQDAVDEMLKAYLRDQ